MTDVLIELLVIYSHTWNHLTLLADVYKSYIYIYIYIYIYKYFFTLSAGLQGAVHSRQSTS